MFKFIANTYKEIYVWFLYNTSNSFISFGLSYLILVVLQYLNVYSIIILFQKLLDIALLEFIFSHSIYVALFVVALLVINFLFLGGIWRKNAEIKNINNHAFAYILVSLMLGTAAVILRR